MFVEHENVVAHYDAMSEDEQHVVARGILLRTKVEKSSQRGFRVGLLAYCQSLAVRTVSAIWGDWGVVIDAMPVFEDFLKDFSHKFPSLRLAIIIPCRAGFLITPELVFEHIADEGIVAGKPDVIGAGTFQLVDEVDVKDMCRRPFGVGIKLGDDVGVMMKAGCFDGFQLRDDADGEWIVAGEIKHQRPFFSFAHLWLSFLRQTTGVLGVQAIRGCDRLFPGGIPVNHFLPFNSRSISNAQFRRNVSVKGY